jgi:hypothetical protein
MAPAPPEIRVAPVRKPGRVSAQHDVDACPGGDGGVRDAGERNETDEAALGQGCGRQRRGTTRWSRAEDGRINVRSVVIVRLPPGRAYALCLAGAERR